MEILEFGFMRLALSAGILAAVACGIIGTYVVVRRIVFISGGIAHTAYGGIGLGYLLGFSPLLGAAGAALFGALIIGIITKKMSEYEDTMIGIVWSTGMALGVLFVALTPGYAPNLMSYLFGSILYVSTFDIILMSILDAVIVITVIIFYKKFLVVSFDPEYSEVRGLPVERLFLLMLCLIALSIVLLIRVVGIILVIALLTIPTAIAGRFAGSLLKIMITSVFLSMFFTVGGLLISYYAGSFFNVNLPSGALIILLAGITYIMTWPLEYVKRKNRLKKILQKYSG